MPLDQFKPQVLLLHSEQSTLDDLSSGFNDRYTVHCATSGSEALNTLVETPINVIITAHDLPGMSGLEALREARKRSPDTIGILLAGTKTKDIKALVGDDDVFQVVSGAVTGEGLLTLVDNATGQASLMMVAESANDSSAGVDESAEHIIMETAENGSTIISDGTGQRPILDPKKVSAATNVASRSIDLLVLTRDLEFLETIKDSSRGTHKVFYAKNLNQAKEAIRKQNIGVAVVDAAVAGEKIEQLTLHLRQGSPRLVSIVGGRRDDGEMLLELVNRGNVYRFLLKPVSPGRARLAVESSIKHHLEAPDDAFEAKSIPAIGKSAATRKTARSAPTPESTAPADSSKESASVLEEGLSVDHGFDDVFDDVDSGFTKTMTGLISSVTKKPPEQNNPYALPTDSGGSPGRKLKVFGIVATILIAAAGGAFWFLGGSAGLPFQIEETSGTPTVAETGVVPETDTAAVEALIRKARRASAAGQIFSPAGNNAIELFAEAMSADPHNASIAIDLKAAIGQALAIAEWSILELKLDDASAALRRVAMIDPQNERLPFLDAQLSQKRLRVELDAARAAIRESRFEDAGNALNAARGLNVPDASEIDVVEAELISERGEQQVDDVLAKATARLNSGDLLRPSNDNARYYFQLVLTTDAGNTAARQGLSVIAGKLAYQARAEIDGGDLKLASDTLASARALDPANSEIAAATGALAAKTAELAEKERIEEANRLALAGQEAEAARQAEADRLLAATTLVAGETPVQKSDPAQSTLYQKPTTVSSLTRTRYVAPKYPISAERRGLSGWVDIVFTVTADGTVADVDVGNSQPAGTFEDAAVKAVEKWEFEPVVENGLVIEKRAGVRMMFASE